MPAVKHPSAFIPTTFIVATTLLLRETAHTFLNVFLAQKKYHIVTSKVGGIVGGCTVTHFFCDSGISLLGAKNSKLVICWREKIQNPKFWAQCKFFRNFVVASSSKHQHKLVNATIFARTSNFSFPAKNFNLIF